MSDKRLAVLCVHGIQGSPRQFDWLIRDLSRTVPTVNLTLPGHGGEVKDFRKSTMAQWQAAVDRALEELSAEHEVLFIGHSMGCLLGIDACARNIGDVRALVLLACPLYIRPTWRYVRNNYLAAAKRHLDDPFVAAAQEMNGVHADHPLAYSTCARQYLQLLKKIRTTRDLLPKIDVPVLAVHFERDEIVSSASLRSLSALPGARTRIVRDSGHFLFSESARAEITEEVLHLLQS